MIIAAAIITLLCFVGLVLICCDQAKENRFLRFELTETKQLLTAERVKNDRAQNEIRALEDQLAGRS